MKLKEVYKLRQELTQMERDLKIAKDTHGITDMEKQITSKQKYLQAVYKDLVDTGHTAEGSLRVIDRGRTVRKVNIERLALYDKDAYECLREHLTLPVGVVEKFFELYPNKDDIMSGICDTTTQSKYDVVDILEGD